LTSNSVAGDNICSLWSVEVHERPEAEAFRERRRPYTPRRPGFH